MALVIDVDSHVYEPPEIWDRYVAEEFRGMARSCLAWAAWGQGG